MKNGHYVFYYNRFEPDLNYDDINVIQQQAKEHMEDAIHILVQEPHRFFESYIKQLEDSGYVDATTIREPDQTDLNAGEVLPSEAEFADKNQAAPDWESVDPHTGERWGTIYQEMYMMPEILVTRSQISGLFAEAGFTRTPDDLMYFDETPDEDPDEPITPEDIANDMEEDFL